MALRCSEQWNFSEFLPKAKGKMRIFPLLEPIRDAAGVLLGAQTRVLDSRSLYTDAVVLLQQLAEQLAPPPTQDVPPNPDFGDTSP